jgi:hypothetical protein
MARDQLIQLLRASAPPGGRISGIDEHISPLAVLFVVGMLVTLFVAIVKL